MNFQDLFKFSEEFSGFIPDFQYLIWDASGYSDEDIRGDAVLRASLLIMKYIFKEELKDRLPEIFVFLKDVFKKQTGMDYIKTLLKYIINAAPSENLDRKDLKKALEKALPQGGGEIMPTIADQLREEGMQQGILQNAKETLIDILEERFNIVPMRVIEAINEISDPTVLKTLRRKSIKAESMEKFREIMELIME